MDIKATFTTDRKLENEGNIFQLDATTKVLVARSGNDAYSRAVRERYEAQQLELAGNSADANAIAEIIMIEVMAETILKGWKGVTENGVEVVYSVAKAKEYLGIKDFRLKIQRFSESFEAYRLRADGEQKNV